MRRLALLVFVVALAPVHPAAASTVHACPADLSAWRTALGAQWIDCHQVADLTTTGNPWTDPGSLTGMGFPPPGSGTLDSHYTNPTAPPVPGLQIDGWFADGCNAFQAEPVLTNKNGQPWMPGCTPAPGAGDCVSDCHHDAAFVLRIPDTWNAHLMTAGTPGIRDQYASDFVLSDYALEKGWAYVSQDKGNMGANFYRDGADEVGSCGTPWCPGAAIKEWNTRMRQATSAARSLLGSVASAYGLKGVTRSYAAGVSNGGYQVRRALETDTAPHRLYDGGVDWEGTLFTRSENLFSYLPTSLAQWPGNVNGDPAAVAAMAAVGFNPQSQPLWNYHWTVYWGLTQKVYRLEMDPEYTAYTCSGTGAPCVSPAAETVPPTDPDAAYNVGSRMAVVGPRIDAVANTGKILHPLITLHGDQDSLLPIKTDSDLYAQMVAAAGRSGSFRYYTVSGGNHVDPQFDDHYGVDSYGDTVLRPMLPSVRSALDGLSAWVEAGTAPPATHTLPRPAGASAPDLANLCSLS